MKLRCFVLAVGACAVTLTEAASPEPADTIARLTREPVTRMDWGLYLLEQDMKRNIQRFQMAYSGKDRSMRHLLPNELLVDYLSDGSDYLPPGSLRIRVNFEAAVAEVSRSSAQELCKQEVALVRKYFAHSGHLDSVFNLYFHPGTPGLTVDQPADLAEQFDRITYVEVGAMLELPRGANGLVHSGFKCHGPLKGNQTDFSDFW